MARAVDDILAQFSCDELIDRLLPTITGPLEGALELYRLHCDRGISSNESLFRTSLDQLIELCSLVSIISGNLRSALKSRGVPSEKILTILGHPAVERYMTVFYPMANGTVARADLEGRLPQRFRSRDQTERSSVDWGNNLERFLTLNAQLLSDDALLEFLFLLDDHVVAGTHITELQRAFANAEEMARWLDRPGRHALLDGLARMLDFCESLHGLLGDIANFPILQGRIWLHYSYWLGNGGARVSQTTQWLVKALSEINRPEEETRSAIMALESTFLDLTTIDRYAGTLLELVAPPLLLPLPAAIH